MKMNMYLIKYVKFDPPGTYNESTGDNIDNNSLGYQEYDHATWVSNL